MEYAEQRFKAKRLRVLGAGIETGSYGITLDLQRVYFFQSKPT